MLKRLRQKFAAKAMESIKKRVESNRERHFTDLTKVQTVLILQVANGNSLPADLNHFVSEFERLGATVDVIALSRQKQAPAQLEEQPNITYVSPADFSWLKLPKSDKILKLLEKNHDYFIDLTCAESGAAACIANASMAKFKIGKIQYSGCPYDFTLAACNESDLGFFEEQLFLYLKKIS